LAMPSAAFDGNLLHKNVYDQASAYAFHICQNHPFLDGNKRVALASALVFLDFNGVEVQDPREELYTLMIGVAEGRKTKSDIADALRRLAED